MGSYCSEREKSDVYAKSPNQALQRAAIGIKCTAAGGRAESAHERWRARVLRAQRAVAELSS